MARSFSHESTGAELGAADCVQRAYILTEAARLQCRQLMSCDSQRPLDEVHRDLGLSGYFCSAEIPPEIRHRCLDAARAVCAQAVDVDAEGWREALYRVFAAILASADALLDAVIEDPSDQMHVAHIHALSASASLDDLLSFTVFR